MERERCEKSNEESQFRCSQNLITPPVLVVVAETTQQQFCLGSHMTHKRMILSTIDTHQQHTACHDPTQPATGRVVQHAS